MSSEPFVLRLDQCHDPRLAGGKARRLAELIAAGFLVPDGFVVTVEAYQQARDRGGMTAELAEGIAAWYRCLGEPAVAVRSSATAEDLADASMAGQYQTRLDVRGAAELLQAVRECWSSVDSDRTRAYLAEHGLEPAAVGMAVVVQRLVPAEVAGVLFTADPRTGARDEMLLEASWGLGEAVASGSVQPDTLRLDRATGRVKTATIADKQLRLVPGTHGPGPVPDAQRQLPCLTSQQVDDLWQLGVRADEYFGAPQDLEWAIGEGRVYLLQTRPITTLAEAESYQRGLEQTRARLRQAKGDGRGDWVRHNLSETLPQPTPLTWSVIQRFMSGAGGFGAMYRMVGFEPSRVVQDAGFLELIAGRVYMDLSRAPGMFFEGFPYRYDVQLLRENPDAAQGPPTLPVGSTLQRYRMGRRLAAIRRRLDVLAQDLDRRLDQELIPAFVQYAASERQRDLTLLDNAQWLELWRERERRVLDEFAPQSLLPSLIAAMAWDQLGKLLEEDFWDEEPRELASLLCAGGPPDQTLRASQGLFELAHGRCSAMAWLESFGHRAPDEFDLAAPRWCERPDALGAWGSRLQGSVSPLTLHEQRTAEADARLQALSRRLPPARQRELETQVRLARRYLRFREDGKHYLMLGYQLLRDLTLDAGRRLGVGADVFFLSLAEVQESLATGFAPLHLMRQRRRTREAEVGLVLPPVITEAEIRTLGQPVQPAAGNRWPAFPISAGLGTGPVRIVLSPDAAGDLGQGYVLVCPSTDPSWTPLFINAAGLVLECGGTLSHGAVVARELGVPAVVWAGATRVLQEGETVLVDGHHGAIVRGAPQAASQPLAGPAEAGTTSPGRASAPAAESSPLGQEAEDPATDPQDTRVPRNLVPPGPGRRERRGARLRNAMLLVWGLYLAAAFGLPEAWLYQPSLELLDRWLWPIVVAWGKPATVAVTAAALAVLTLVGQRFLSDHRRLCVAKARAQRLRQLARQWPDPSPRRQALLRLARPVQRRLVTAALLPVALLLGPLVMSFLWFPCRVDPAAANARPGATVHVVATVDGEHTAPVTLTQESALTLDEATPAAQSLPPIRATLEQRLAKWQQMSDLSSLPWEVQEAGRWIRQSLTADLSEYLGRDLPPQSLAWTLHTPRDQPGRYRVTLTTEDGPAIETRVVVGDAYPPERKLDLGDGKGPVQVVRPALEGSPVRQVKVTYFEPQRQSRPVFWAPLACCGRPDWGAGWLLTYLLAYLPVMVVLRWLLRLP